ncbi:MAG: UDP-N-acetylmuramoyl-L-alanyl-D-glutamate--2,6-diaminopimelate ligase [Candidatus Saccharibacteria bacterium]|nr:UDP-N-acetylmuramoyl-L-alanyl-D-glutamate--2,6-diaminopimelate ligase [Candidatus Saccharibacteria bacterium]
MKTTLVKAVRRVLPAGALPAVEQGYRRARVRLLSARYGNPSKHLRVIAVTGTNGKTTTACYINEILKEAGFRTAMFTTALIEVAGEAQINDLNATVASTARMQRFFRDAKRAGVDYVVLEITSHALDQHKLDGVPIEAAVMTNLTQDHLDYHKTMDEYAAAKAKLFALKPRFIVLNRDDAWFEYFDQFVAEEQKMTYGTHAEAEAKITRVKLYRKGTEADVVLDHQTHLELATNLPGEFNVLNMTAATTLAYLLGVKLQDIQEGVANLEAVPGRFERAVEGLPYDVIVDYAHTPDALEKLLATARDIARGRVMLVFGACGDRDQSKRPIMGEIAARGADRIFLTDEESYNEDPEQIRRMLHEGIERAGGAAKTTEIADRREAITRALGAAKKGDMVLITGMGHEQYRIVNGERLPWNDTEVVREITRTKA